MRRVLLGLLLLPGSPVALGAQQPSVPPEAPAEAEEFCFRGRPPPRCGTFLLTEFGIAATRTRGRRPGVNALWDLGAMRNIGEDYAVGGTLSVVFDEDERVLLALRPRGRLWLDRSFSLELAPGVLVTHLEPPAGASDLRFPGFSTQVALNYADWLALFAQLEVLRSRHAPDPTEVALFGGLRAGSYAGVGLWPVAAGFFYLISQITD